MREDPNHSPAPELQVLPDIAREAISAHLEGRQAHPPAEPVGPLATPAPVFVTLRMDRAVAAAVSDPRFPPLTLGELPRTIIEVSILSPLEPVQSEADLDPKIYGIEIQDDSGRRAVLLPDIEGVDTVEQQIAITREKAWIGPDVPITIRRFHVIKVEEQ